MIRTNRMAYAQNDKLYHSHKPDKYNNRDSTNLHYAFKVLSIVLCFHGVLINLVNSRESFILKELQSFTTYINVVSPYEPETKPD